MIPWFVSDWEDSSRTINCLPYPTSTIILTKPKYTALVPYSDSDSCDINEVDKLSSLNCIADSQQNQDCSERLNTYECIPSPRFREDSDLDYNPIDNTSDNVEEYEATSSNANTNEVRVMKNNNVGKQRIYDKRDACLYCDKLVSKLSEHLNLVHTNEVEVAKVFAFKKKQRTEARVTKFAQ